MKTGGPSTLRRVLSGWPGRRALGPLVRSDHRLAFRAPRLLVTVELAADGATVPIPETARAAAAEAAARGAGITAFLTLEVRAGVAGRLRDPFVELHAVGGSSNTTAQHRQYLDRAAWGSRPINVTPLLRSGDPPSGAIRLVGRGVTWRREATLTLYDPPTLRSAGDGRTLVLAPHPDDAEIAAFGLFADRPAGAWIAAVTAGEAASMELVSVVPGSPAEQAAWRAELRVWDSLTIPQLGGVAAERCLALVYPDRQLAAMAREPERPFFLGSAPVLSRRTLRSRNAAPALREAPEGCRWVDLVEELRGLLLQIRPDVVVCPHPRLDHHPDHLFTAVALEEALRGAGLPPPTLLLYVVHPPGAPDYPPGAPDGLVSLPPWKGEEGEWLGDALYSHALSPDLQRRKHFAVEAAHDVRRHYPSERPPRAGEVLARLGRDAAAALRGRTVDPRSFLRRAPRPNELFTVVGLSSFAELVAAARARALAPGGFP